MSKEGYVKLIQNGAIPGPSGVRHLAQSRTAVLRRLDREVAELEEKLADKMGEQIQVKMDLDDLLDAARELKIAWAFYDIDSSEVNLAELQEIAARAQSKGDVTK